MSLKERGFLDGIECLSMQDNVTIEQADQDRVSVVLGSRQTVLLEDLDTTSPSVTKTFLAPSFKPMTSGILWHKTPNGQGEFVTVLNGDSLLRWDGKATKLEHVDSIRVSRPSKIDALIKETDTDSIWALFSNDMVCPIDLVGSVEQQRLSCHDPLLAAGAVRLHTWIHTLVKGKHILLTHKYRTKHQSCNFVTYKVVLNGDEVAINLSSKKVFSDSSMVNATVLGSLKNELRIYYVHKNCSLYYKEVLSDMPSNFVCTLSENMGHDVQEFGVLDTNHLCLLSDRCDGEGALLQLINITFGCVLDTLNVKTISGGNSSGILPCHGHRVFLRHGKRVALVTAKKLPECLEDLMELDAADNSFLEKANDDPTFTENFGAFFGTIASSKTEKDCPMSVYRILPDILRQKNLTKLEALLSADNDIPELLLLNIIEFLFALSESDFPAGGEVQREKLLKLAFDVPITDNLMLQHLGNLNFKMALKILDFLTMSFRVSQGEHDSTFKHYLQWLSLLLSAHYTQLRLSKEQKVMTCVLNAQDAINELESSAIECQALLPLVNKIKKKESVESPYVHLSYCIEKVDI